MAEAAGRSGRKNPPNPSPATSGPAPVPMPPARRSGAPRRATQLKDTACPACSGDRSDSRRMTHCHGKKAPEDGSSGGTDAKPGTRVNLIPSAAITYVRHRKPFGVADSSAVLNKRQCRRSATSSSANVSNCSWTSSNTDANAPNKMNTTGSRKSFLRNCSSRVLHCQVQSSAIPPDGSPIIHPTQRSQSKPPAQLSNDFEATPSTKSQISNEEQTYQKALIDVNMSSGAAVILHSKLHKSQCQPKACWKGKFEMIGKPTQTFDGLEAHFPLDICIEAYEASKQMPEILKLKVLPLSRLWPKKFKMGPPGGQDIALSFISSPERLIITSHRPNMDFDNLLENTSIGLRTDVGTTELLIFSSKLLKQGYQRNGGKFYFWGVYRKRQNHTDNAQISNASLSNGDTRLDRSEDTCVSMDLTKDKEAKSDSSRFGMKLDATEAHSRLRIGGTAQPYIGSSPTLSLGTHPEFVYDAPPGFTIPHRRLHTKTCAGPETDVSSTDYEKKPTIKISPDIARPVGKDVASGFTKLVTVKEEPGLRAVYKDTEQITPIGKVKMENDELLVDATHPAISPAETEAPGEDGSTSDSGRTKRMPKPSTRYPPEVWENPDVATAAGTAA